MLCNLASARQVGERWPRGERRQARGDLGVARALATGSDEHPVASG